MVMLALIGAFILAYMAYKKGIEQGYGERAAEYENEMTARANYYANVSEPIYHFSAHPFDFGAEERARFDRVQLDAIGKQSIPIHCIPFRGVGLNNESFAREKFSDYIFRVANEIEKSLNDHAKSYAKQHGAARANQVFAGQKVGDSV